MHCIGYLWNINGTAINTWFINIIGVVFRTFILENKNWQTISDIYAYMSFREAVVRNPNGYPPGVRHVRAKVQYSIQEKENPKDLGIMDKTAQFWHGLGTADTE